jgi:hypothetical protein
MPDKSTAPARWADLTNLSYPEGYPTDATLATLYDEIDFQRACQCYIWAMPTVALNEVNVCQNRDLGVALNEIALFQHFVGPEAVGLTPNNTTIYALCVVDLAGGPMVVDSPEGAYGVIDDYWQRPIVEVGPFGPDKGNGGKFLLLPPRFAGDVPAGYFVGKSPTTRAMFVLRAIVKDGDIDGAVDTLKALQVYPLSEAGSPPPTKIVPVSGKPANSVAPAGYDYWERLAEIVDLGSVEERDRFFLAMLEPLGIEKGKPFSPDERQKAILTTAAAVGFRMCQAISAAPRFAGVVAYPGTHWEYVLTLNADQRADNSEQLDERTDYTFEAITVAKGMIEPIVGAGSQYLSAAKDAHGRWLSGGSPYRLHIPANVPVANFWSVTVYDNMTRSMVRTDTNKAALSSYDALQTNDDGSIDLWFGPSAPAGKASNWIATLPGKGWFTYFRWYGPTEAIFDKSWRLPDIEPA